MTLLKGVFSAYLQLPIRKKANQEQTQLVLEELSSCSCCGRSSANILQLKLNNSIQQSQWVEARQFQLILQLCITTPHLFSASSGCSYDCLENMSSNTERKHFSRFSTTTTPTELEDFVDILSLFLYYSPLPNFRKALNLEQHNPVPTLEGAST